MGRHRRLARICTARPDPPSGFDLRTCLPFDVTQLGVLRIEVSFEIRGHDDRVNVGRPTLLRWPCLGPSATVGSGA
jgi:hypothetical protein